MHFTYAPADSNCLHQGDILRRTRELDAALSEIHPHYYRNDENKRFMVLTQSCDLVPRGGGSCASKYISLAAVRTLRYFLAREADRYLFTPFERRFLFAESSRQGRYDQFVDRLLNNNEEEYFFLRQEPAIGLDEDHCAFLKLSVPLRADEHYTKLLAAKQAQLAEGFQHKLGYLVGQMYARPGTTDWQETLGADALAAAREEAKRHFPKITFLSREIHNALAARLRELGQADPSPAQFEQILKEATAEKEARRQQLFQLIRSLAVKSGIDAAGANKLLNELRISPDLKAIWK